MSHDIEQHNTAPSATRRTVLAGAAWSVPVIAAASIAPMASASGAPALAFDKSTYNGTACSTIAGAYVTVTVDGVASAGKSVTTTLSNGYKFSDGATTNTQVSGSDGLVSLPTISVPAQGGSGTLTATAAGAAAASATFSAPAVARAYVWDTTNGTRNFTAIPSNATPLPGWGIFLDGTDLWYWGSKRYSNVTKADGTSGNGGNSVNFISSGSAHTWDTKNGQRDWTSVPSTAVPLSGWGYFLDGGDLWYWGSKRYSNVTAVSSSSGNDNDVANFIQAGKAYTYDGRTNKLTNWSSVPSTATPLRMRGGFLDGTNLWYGNTKKFQNVTRANGTSADGADSFNFIQNNVAYTWDSKNGLRTWSGVPADATPMAGWGFFASGTDIYYWGSKVASNVVLASATSGDGGDTFNSVNYIKASC